METWAVTAIVVAIVSGGMLYVFRRDVQYALVVAAEVMHEYNDQYNHEFLDDDEKSD